MNSRRLREHGERVPTMRSNYVSIPPQFASSPTAALINPLLQARPAVPVRRCFRGRPQQCRRQRKAPACYRGMMPPGAKRYAQNNTSTSAPPMSSTLFLSIASSPFLAASLHDLTSPVHFSSALRSALRCSAVRTPLAEMSDDEALAREAHRRHQRQFRKSLVTRGRSYITPGINAPLPPAVWNFAFWQFD